MELVTRFPDGTEVLAVPPADADLVEQLHDLVHHLLAQAMLLPFSPTLWRQAHQQRLDDDLIRYEEAAVLAITAYAQALRG